MLFRCYQILFASAALVASALLTDCKRKVNPPSEQVVQAINESLRYYDDDAELRMLIEAYKKTGDATLVAKDGTTMLHLACTSGHVGLIQHLLQQGADPNAWSKTYQWPIECLFYIPRDKPAETRLMINLLLAHGAKVMNYSRFSENLDESTYIYLLKQSWKGDTGHFVGTLPALNGWSTAFLTVLDKAGTPLPDEYKIMMHELAEGDVGEKDRDSQYLDCAQLLVSKGVSIEQEDAHGTTPIMTAAKAALAARLNGDGECRPSDMLQLLLQSDANVYRTFEQDPDFPGYCAYDLLMANGQLMSNLKALGYTFEAPPPLEFTEGADLLRTVVRAALRCESKESLRAAFGQIATLLAPDEKLKAHADYPDALCSAINLLMRADEVQGTAAVAAMPLWTDEEFWFTDSELPLLVLNTIQQNEIAISPELLLPLAQKAESTGHLMVAAELMELLAYSLADDEVLVRYTHDSRIALQAGAWQALLQRKDLPTAKSGSIADWLWNHGQQTAETPEMKRALRLTSHYRIWEEYSHVDPQEQELFFEDLEALGATETAEWYREAAAMLDAGETKETAGQGAEEHFFHIECITARFLLEHADMFAEKEE